MKVLVACIAVIAFSVFPLNAFADNTGLLQINIFAANGERVTYQGITLKVYQDTNQTATIMTLTDNPYSVHLPLGHRYKVEAYASSMFFDVDFADMSQPNQKMDLSMPNPGSASLSIAYSDGYTPIPGASVSIRSGDGTYRYWTNSTTDSLGNTIRYWLQPTVSQGDHYVADISIGDGLYYTSAPIRINPGVSQDIKLVTPWPKVIDSSILVSLLDSDSHKVSGLGKNLMVDASDKSNSIVGSFKIGPSGDAYLSNLKVGSYLIRVMNMDEGKELGSTRVILDGKTTSIKIPETITQNKAKPLQNILPVDNATSFPIPNSMADPVEPPIPQWIRNVASWWSQGQISDSEFLKAIKYLVDSNIVVYDSKK